jgi:hypothetical protein
VAALQKPEPRSLDWQNATELLLPVAAELECSLGETLAVLEWARGQLNTRDWQSVRDYDWELLVRQMDQAYDNYGRTSSSINIGELEYLRNGADGEHADNERQSRRIAQRTLQSPGNFAANFMDRFRSVIERLKKLREPDLHAFGDAGFGKTHLCCHVCRERLESGLPAVLVLGKHFTTEQPLEQQLLSILDIPPTYSWNDFLRALESVARAYRTRIPIIIDGLNEATAGGVFSRVWQRGLPGLCRELSHFESVVLVTTCRNSYRREVWGENSPQNFAYVHGFEMENVREAVGKYFHAYKIKADLTATPLYQFRHPIYLKIYCEVANPERREEKQVYVGEQSLFETFDAYLRQCNEAVCRRFGFRHGTQLVVPALNRLATYLWERHTRRVPLSEATELIDGKRLDELRWETSRTRACESEGLLVCRDWGNRGDELFFTYDLLGGYLIARALLDKHRNDLEEFFNAADTVRVLYTDEHSSLHPMHEDIRRSLAALLPAHLNRYLHDITDNEIAFSDSVAALFEIAPKDVDDSCTALVAQLFAKEQNRVALLERSASTFFHVSHPLNARFWHERLRDMPMHERDISWTEYVRSAAEGHGERLHLFEERCRNRDGVAERDKERLDLQALGVLWLLTSTVRPLRDKATRALYWYGRRFPQSFFNLLIDSFAINDPYVLERMLAAAYGIAMARQHDWDDLSFAKGDLPQWGRALYERMFAPTSPNATTHILSRDYAHWTIEIALLHHPNLLTQEERERIQSPYQEGGIREWGESEDLDRDKYREGNAPLGMDFDNYTLGHLVEDRRNYDSEHPGYRKVRANVLWRIYDLGFTLERFGKIDQWIARGNWNRDNDPNKVDRYGKKYSWIAYFELAGFMQDQGALAGRFERYGGERISDADIDPSFPDKMPENKIVHVSYLGSSDMTTQAWINDGGVPDVSKFLVVGELMNEDGPWVLLDGYINQEDKQLDRNRFTFIRTLLVREGDSSEIITRLTQQDMKNRWLPEIPESHYLYAGEITWCVLFPENEWSDLEFTEDEESDDADAIKPEVDSHAQPDETERAMPSLYIFETAPGALSIVNLGLSDEDSSELETVIEAAQEILEGEGKDAFEEAVKLRFPETRFTWFVEPAEVKPSEFQALVPVREYGWEGYHSIVNEAGGGTVLARQITDSLDLCGQPQTFDLFEPGGRRATMTWRHGEEEKNVERFVYIRRELLERFLAEQGMKMVWVTWGERQYSVTTMSHRASSFRGKGEAPWRVFQQVTIYPELSVQREPAE